MSSKSTWQMDQRSQVFTILVEYKGEGKTA